MFKKCVDVSSWNGKCDWKKMKEKGVEAAIIKVIRRDLEYDSQFINNYKGCEKYDIPWGVYNYSYAITPEKARSDMKLICDRLDKLNKKHFKYGIWFDIEDRLQAQLSKTKIADIINAAQKVVESRGYKFGVYTGLMFYREHISLLKVKCRNFCIARYYLGYNRMFIYENPNPRYKPIIGPKLFAWQYTSSGRIAPTATTGNSGNVDLSIIYTDFPKPKKYTKVKPSSDKKAIKWLQKSLNKNCNSIREDKMKKLAVDGIWGKHTWTALRSYWKQLGWDTTGSHAGKKTCKALYDNRRK